MSTSQAILAILNHGAYAEWAAAAGTLLLALVTILIIFIGDSYTRLIRDQYTHEFKKLAYAFLDTSLASWSLQAPSPTTPTITVEESINQFNKAVIDNKIYLSICNRRKSYKYITLAKKHALSWTNRDPDKEIWMRKIAREMQKLSRDIGKEDDIENKLKAYPWLFKRKCKLFCWRIKK